ncbi:hypothetical protein Rsub_01303 [Raphidocelis subcapitata]|uniref:Uncharacterized protein n=1 Tax=Raphidocelis subcapitata TaxID=307507 RepID=A0A2V0NM74_9CHLO|nr:hypothetical protein Rsub_01303 [Raphidocelis subcapitata]|eukprot:GBF88588.1 hypothetical protein Rsub_01303 [Raphidocelis subcapitata]
MGKPQQLQHPQQAPELLGGPWSVAVRFVDRGVLRADAAGAIARLMPEDALRIITHPAGDELFRVVVRRAVAAAADVAAGAAAEADGGDAERVEVENRAPVRVLAYKFWAVSRVLFTVRLSKPLPATATCGKRGAPAGRAGSSVAFTLLSSNMLKELSGGWRLEPLLAPGCGAAAVAGTRLHYMHDVRPKGLPPGVQYVPGMSGAVRASVAKEVQQMVDKVTYVADKVCRGLPVVVALEQTVEELRAAGGSFKKLRKRQQQLQGQSGVGPQMHPLLKSVPLVLDFDALDGAA